MGDDAAAPPIDSNSPSERTFAINNAIEGFSPTIKQDNISDIIVKTYSNNK
jgi:hypothetical protein